MHRRRWLRLRLRRWRLCSRVRTVFSPPRSPSLALGARSVRNQPTTCATSMTSSSVTVVVVVVVRRARALLGVGLTQRACAHIASDTPPSRCPAVAPAGRRRRSAARSNCDAARGASSAGSEALPPPLSPLPSGAVEAAVAVAAAAAAAAAARDAGVSGVVGVFTAALERIRALGTNASAATSNSRQQQQTRRGPTAGCAGRWHVVRTATRLATSLAACDIPLLRIARRARARACGTVVVARTSSEGDLAPRARRKDERERE